MFILQNQDGYFLSKSGEWVDGREPNTLFRTLYRDEAVNQLFETNSHDYSLRITIINCEHNPKKIPIIPDGLLPPPLVTEAESTDLLSAEPFSEEPILTNGQHA